MFTPLEIVGDTARGSTYVKVAEAQAAAASK